MSGVELELYMFSLRPVGMEHACLLIQMTEQVTTHFLADSRLRSTDTF